MSSCESKIFFQDEQVFDVHSGLWQFHRVCVSKKKNDIEKFPKKLRVIVSGVTQQ